MTDTTEAAGATSSFAESVLKARERELGMDEDVARSLPQSPYGPQFRCCGEGRRRKRDANVRKAEW